MGFDRKAGKRAVNVSVNGDLLDQSKALKINLSKALEARLEEEVAAASRRAWLAENQEAMEDYNRAVAERGVFGDDARSF